MMDRIPICDKLTKQNEIEPFLKRMVTGDEKGVTYDNIGRKRSWSKCDEAVQTVAKPELAVRKFYCVFGNVSLIFDYNNARSILYAFLVLFLILPQHLAAVLTKRPFPVEKEWRLNGQAVSHGKVSQIGQPRADVLIEIKL
ncbi:putative DD34D transposase [Trichonephila clavipes]|nr:putative DD34D transposase [Trichonephila clavipes]